MAASGGMFDFGGGVNFNPMAVMKTGGTVQPRIGGQNNTNIGGGGSTIPAATSSYPGGDYTANNLFPYGSTGNTSVPSSLTGGNLFPGITPSGNLSNIFGPLGPYLISAIQSGYYNPDVYTALVNQLQPQVERGIATIGANAGATGTRFGSGYDLALGDYLSQVNANEAAMAAGLYENAASLSAGLLGGAAGQTAQFKSNKGGFTTALLSSLIGALGPTLAGKLIPGLSGGGGGGGNSSGGGINWGQILSGISIGSGIPTIGTDIPSSIPTGPTGIGGGNINNPFGYSFGPNPSNWPDASGGGGMIPSLPPTYQPPYQL